MNVNFKSSLEQGKSLFFGKSNDGKKTLLRPVNLPIIPPPVPIDGLLVRFNADSGITELNGSITAWTDQQNGVIATAFNGPILLTNEFNGRKAVSFDGINDYFAFSLPSLLTSSQSRSIIIIGKYTNPTGRGQNGMLNSRNPQDRAYVFHNAVSSDAYFFTNNSQFGPKSFTPNTYMTQVIVHRANGSGFIRINGVQGGNVNADLTLNLLDFIIGGRTPSSERFLGAIVEILIYNRELTTEEIEQIESYSSVN